MSVQFCTQNYFSIKITPQNTRHRGVSKVVINYLLCIPLWKRELINQAAATQYTSCGRMRSSVDFHHIESEFCVSYAGSSSEIKRNPLRTRNFEWEARTQNWFAPRGAQWSAFFGPPMLTIKLKVTGLFNFNNVKLTWGGRTGRKWARSLASWLESRARFSPLSKDGPCQVFFHSTSHAFKCVAPCILSHGQTQKSARGVIIFPTFHRVRFAGNLCNYGTSRNVAVRSEISSVSQGPLLFRCCRFKRGHCVHVLLETLLTLEWKMWSKKRLPRWETNPGRPSSVTECCQFSPAAGDNVSTGRPLINSFGTLNFVAPSVR